jgi:hypothetical protein
MRSMKEASSRGRTLDVGIDGSGSTDGATSSDSTTAPPSTPGGDATNGTDPTDTPDYTDDVMKCVNNPQLCSGGGGGGSSGVPGGYYVQKQVYLPNTSLKTNVWETIQEAEKGGRVQPMRIKFLYGYTESADQRCQNVGATVNTCTLWETLGVGGSFCNQYFYCDTKDVVDDTKIRILKDRTDWVQKKVAQLFQVKPVQDKISIDGAFGGNLPYLSQTTIEDVDLVIVVTMYPIDARVSGYAKCFQVDQYNRCTAGLLNWVPGSMRAELSDVYESVGKDRHTLLHEVFHLLGAVLPEEVMIDDKGALRPHHELYDYSVFGNYFTDDTAVTRHVKTPKLLATAKEQWGCDSIKGVPTEDIPMGKDLHWEARIFGPELMAYGFASGESYLSDLTLAYFEDTNQYIANYSAAGVLIDPIPDKAILKSNVFFLFGDGSNKQAAIQSGGKKLARSPGYARWGRQAGCDFFLESPRDWPGKYKCDKSDLKGCTFDNKMAATCVIKNWDEFLGPKYMWFTDTFGQPDPLKGGNSDAMDFVPIQVGFMNCRDKNAAATAAKLNMAKLSSQDRRQQEALITIRTYGGQEMCENCRCIESTLKTATNEIFQSGVPMFGLCYRTNCVHAEYLQVNIQGVWFSCPPEGGAIYIVGMTGQLQCPVAKDFCAQEPQSGIFYPEISSGRIWALFIFIFVSIPLSAILSFCFPDARKWITRHSRHFFGVTSTSDKEGLMIGEVAEDWKATRNVLLRRGILVSAAFFLLFALAMWGIAAYLGYKYIDAYPQSLSIFGLFYFVFPLMGFTSIGKGKPTNRILFYFYFVCFQVCFSIAMLIIQDDIRKATISHAEENWEIWRFAVEGTAYAVTDNADAAAGIVTANWYTYLLLMSFSLLFSLIGAYSIWRLLHTRILVHNFFAMSNIALVCGTPFTISSIVTNLYPLNSNVAVHLIVPMAMMIPIAIYGLLGHYNHTMRRLNKYVAALVTLLAWQGGTVLYAVTMRETIISEIKMLSDAEIGELMKLFADIITGIQTKNKLITSLDAYIRGLNVFLGVTLIVLLLMCYSTAYIEKDFQHIDDNLEGIINMAMRGGGGGGGGAGHQVIEMHNMGGRRTPVVGKVAKSRSSSPADGSSTGSRSSPASGRSSPASGSGTNSGNAGRRSPILIGAPTPSTAANFISNRNEKEEDTF